MNQRPRHRTYIDEAGNPHLGNNSLLSNRYLSLTSVTIEQAQLPAIQQEMDALKIKYFGSAALVLHRNEIEIHRGPFNVLNNAATMQMFGQELSTLLKAWPYTVITVCIDKLTYYQHHKGKVTDPFFLCLRVLLHNYASFLEAVGSIGDVMVEARGKSEDIKLEREFTRLWRKGIEGKQLYKLLTSKQIKTRLKSGNEIGLQLADLLAYPSQQEILRDAAHSFNITSLSAQIIDAISGKYYPQGGKEFLI